MPVLHTVNQTPFRGQGLASCLRHARTQAGVILIEDGVYAALRGAASEPAIRQALARLSIYALEPDVIARGLPAPRLVEGIGLVDYSGFVELCVRYDKVVAWL